MDRAGRSALGKRIAVSSSGRYFVDAANGARWFYLADTAWALFKRLDPKEVEHYLSNRAAKGFTAIQAYVLRGLEVPNREGHVPLVDHDPTRLDEGFFGNIDRVVRRANELGLVMGLVATMGEHVRHKAASERFPDDREQIFNRDNAYRFGEILGERYRECAVIWYLGGDRHPIPEDVLTWDAMARGLKAGSEGSHLVSYHSGGGYSSSEPFHRFDWLDFNTVQSIHRSADPNYALVRRDREFVPAKPTLDMENRYEDHPDLNEVRYSDHPDIIAAASRVDAHQVREAAYWAMLAGAAGHGYGHNAIWQMATGERDASEYSFPAVPARQYWRDALDTDGVAGLGHMRRLVEQYPWHRFAPDLTVIAAGQGLGEAHIQSARDVDGRFVLAYLPFGHRMSVYLDRVAGATVLARWYDPRAGTFEDIGSFGAHGEREFVPPTSGPVDDWVLVLEAGA